MKWLNGYKMRVMLVGFAFAIVFGGGRAQADFTFGTPTPLDEPVNSTGIDYFDCISADGLELYLDKPVGGGIASKNWDLYVSTRETINDPWSVPANLGPTVNSSGVIDGCACLSSDGLELYFGSRRSDGYGRADLWVTKRPYKGADWASPENLGPPINTSASDDAPWITPDGLELYFSSDRPGGYGNYDLWVAKRPTIEDDWGSPVNLGSVVNSMAYDALPCLSADGLVLFFSDYPVSSGPYRPGGLGRSDLWMTQRKSIADPWEPPVNLGPELNSSTYDDQPRLSPDNSILYFTSERSGGHTSGYNIWQVPIIPIVDLNGDGIVDSADMCIMVDNWGTDEPLCDIGPMPWGDGIVDIKDLIALSEHLFEDYRLIALWKLDETEGGTAYDSVSGEDAFVIVDPEWQPTGGMVDGALQLDGIDDCVITNAILDPVESPFSVFVWIKGGAPGQVVLSQIGASNWLCTDSSEGNLMTELTGGRDSGPLQSQTVITDGTWHRVGFVWDSSHRTLYIDGVVVAEDTQNNLASSNNGLYIGCGKNMQPGTFFSGLIDDVRIYNKALSAEEIAALAQ